jgi:hypothetical protein
MPTIIPPHVSPAPCEPSLVDLINTYNEATAPYVMRTAGEHDLCRAIAKESLAAIRSRFTLGRDYQELSNGMLWTVWK